MLFQKIAQRTWLLAPKVNYSLNIELHKYNRAPLLKARATPLFSKVEAIGTYVAEGLKAQVYIQDDALRIDTSYVTETGAWHQTETCELVESGMGDYFAVPKVHPLQDSINFHDLLDSGNVTHMRITQRLCRKVPGG